MIGSNLAVSAVRSTPQGIVVRVYETDGQVCVGAQLCLSFPIQAAAETNLIEAEARTISCIPGTRIVQFNIGPFEIKTFRLQVQREPNGSLEIIPTPSI